MKKTRRILMLTTLCLTVLFSSTAKGAKYVAESDGGGYFSIVSNKEAAPMLIDPKDDPGVIRAFNDLQNDILKVSQDRKSTRLNSSPRPHLVCRLLLEKKNNNTY